MISSNDFLLSKQKTVFPDPPLVLILMGPPGAGKGTHAPHLSAHLQIPHISTGDLFRDHIRRQTEIGQKAKHLIDSGLLVPDEIVTEMVFQRISMQDCQEGFLLDGFPRTPSQAQALDEKIQSTHKILVLQLNVSPSLLIDRIVGRLSCKQCGRSYHKTYAPPHIENVCDACLGSLHQRSDDTEEVFKKRLQLYKQETEPVIEHYRNQQDVLFEIDGGLSKQQVLHQILCHTHCKK